MKYHSIGELDVKHLQLEAPPPSARARALARGGACPLRSALLLTWLTGIAGQDA